MKNSDLELNERDIQRLQRGQKFQARHNRFEDEDYEGSEHKSRKSFKINRRLKGFFEQEVSE